MQILVTGVSGYVGASLAPALAAEGHRVRGFARSPERVAAAGVVLDELVTGDALTGAGLEEAMDGVEVAYYLIHALGAGAGFAERDRSTARGFAVVAREVGIGRVVYLGGLYPEGERLSPHLESRREVEEILLDGNKEAQGLEFFSLGVYDVCPAGDKLAYAVDTTGDERFDLRIKDLTTGEVVDEAVTGIGYGSAWSTDGT